MNCLDVPAPLPVPENDFADLWKKKDENELDQLIPDENLKLRSAKKFPDNTIK